jgi:hypothetical protein
MDGKASDKTDVVPNSAPQIEKRYEAAALAQD